MANLVVSCNEEVNKSSIPAQDVSYIEDLKRLVVTQNLDRTWVNHGRQHWWALIGEALNDSNGQGACSESL
jgi:hypothetical protein